MALISNHYQHRFCSIFYYNQTLYVELPDPEVESYFLKYHEFCISELQDSCFSEHHNLIVKGSFLQIQEDLPSQD
jgi:hypothetical protein